MSTPAALKRGYKDRLIIAGKMEASNGTGGGKALIRIKRMPRIKN
jgi:hypothetical protein